MLQVSGEVNGKGIVIRDFARVFGFVGGFSVVAGFVRLVNAWMGFDRFLDFTFTFFLR